MVRDQVVAAWRTPEAAAIPADAHIRDADPAEHGGLYDAAQQLTGLLRSVKGVGWTTAYKVLHIKRPSLFPLLDARLRQTYRQAEAEWRTDHPSVRPGGRNFWAVIRADVIDPFNRSSLERSRETFRRESPLRPLTGLSDVRLLDILAWRLAGPNGS